MRRVLGALLGAVVVLVLGGLFAGGWYYTNELLPAALADETPARDVEVIDVGGGTITLRVDGAPAWDRTDLAEGIVLGFQHDHGYLHLLMSTGPAQQTGDPTTHTRAFEVVAGAAPTAGDRGDVQAYAYPGDPEVLGLPVESISVPGPLGDLPAWRFEGSGRDADRWVVLVPGRGATRAETLRMVDIVVGDLGRAALVITYRNGEGAPLSPDGFGHYGDAEWLDLQAALAWLTDTVQPVDVTLVGFSQGGSVVSACLQRCADVDAVTAVVLDSPLLSMHETLELQARNRNIPGPVIAPLLVATKVVSALRGGPDFANLEHVDMLARMDLPILAFHGRGDTTVPFAPTARLADADPGDVTFVPHDGEHVRGWNADPAGYRRAVIDFLGAR